MAIGVVIEPLVAWLWTGGLLVGLGGVLALVPGSRRRATDPVSAPIGHGGRHQAGSRTREARPGRRRHGIARPPEGWAAATGAAGRERCPEHVMTRGKRRHTARWAAGVVLLLLAVVGVVLATRTPQEATAVQSPLVGRMAPQFSGSNIQSRGATPRVTALHAGALRLSIFFASWCGPCQQEAPDLISFYYEKAPRTEPRWSVWCSMMKWRRPRVS